MTGPYFTKPTLRNVLCNVPLTISFFVLMLLSKIVPVPMGLSILFVLPVIVASAFVTGAYDVLHRKATFLTFPISLLLSLVLIHQFLQNTNLTLWFSSGDENKTTTWLLCVVLCLLAAPILTFFINWMLMRDDDSQSEVFESLLNSKILYTVVVCCIAIAVVLFAVFIFNPYFWYDEGFTLKLIQLSYTDVIDVTALDVHPPLYYIMLKAWLSVLSFGSNDLYVITVLSHLFSLVAYVLTGLLCLKKIHDGGESCALAVAAMSLCIFGVLPLWSGNTYVQLGSVFCNSNFPLCA
ncbi:MAG: hypothetical protein LUI08_05235 [Prevotella sp.]|nr:hypothetical protein [Prevotella sp.]